MSSRLKSGIAEPAVSPLVGTILQDAVKDSLPYFKAGKPGRGHYELVRGALRVARLTNEMESIEALSDLRYVEVA